MQGADCAGRRGRALARAIYLVPLVALLAAACGGGGGGDGGGSQQPPPSNRAPTIAAQTFTGDEDANISGTIAATDPENGTLSFARISDPTRGTVSAFQANGAFTYRGNADANGNDSFQVRVSDSGGLNATATITIDVRAVNDGPVLAPQTFAGDEDTDVSGTIVATDVDGGPFTFARTTDPTLGTFGSFQANGTFTYRGNSETSGTDTFRVRVTDNAGASAETTMTLAIRAVNDPPVMAAQAFAGNEDADITGTIVASDPDSATLTFMRISDPTRGTVGAFQPNGAFTYRGNPDANGSDSFQVRVNDGAGLTAVATITINVQPVADALVARDDVMALTGGPVVTLDVLANDSNPDGGPLQLQITSGPSVGTAIVTPAGDIELDVGAGFAGFVRLDYNVTDGGNVARSARALAFVNAVPQKVLYLAQFANGLNQLWVHDFLDARPVSPATDVCVNVTGNAIAPARGGTAVLYPRCDPGPTVRELEVAQLEGSGPVRTVPALPAGSQFTAWAISGDGAHVAYSARLPATATEPETCVVRTAPVINLAAVATLHSDDTATGWCGGVGYSLSGQYLHSGLRAANATEAAFVRWPTSGGPIEFVFGSLTTPRRLQACQTFFDDNRHVCVGSLAPGDNSLNVMLVTVSPRDERVLNPAPFDASVTSIVNNANRQLTAVGFATLASNPLQRRLYAADLSSPGPGQEIGAPHPDRLGYSVVNFSVDGETMMILDRFPSAIASSLQGYETAYEARRSQSWQLNRIHPSLADGDTLTAALPRVVAGNDAVLVVSRVASASNGGVLLRVPRANPSQAANFGPDGGILNYFVAFEDNALVAADGFRSDTPGRTITILNSSTEQGQLVISSPTGTAVASFQTPFTIQPER